MPNIGPMELAIVAVIALLILGPKRLPSAGRSLGRGIREFKDGIGGRANAELDAAAEQPAASARTSAWRPRSGRSLAGSGQPVDLGDRPAQLLERRDGALAERVAAGGEGLVERAVVPADRVALAGLEAVPERVAVGAVVEQDRAGVVELVGERDAQLVGLLVGDRVEVGALALVPRRLGLGRRCRSWRARCARRRRRTRRGCVRASAGRRRPRRRRGAARRSPRSRCRPSRARARRPRAGARRTGSPCPCAAGAGGARWPAGAPGRSGWKAVAGRCRSRASRVRSSHGLNERAMRLGRSPGQSW